MGFLNSFGLMQTVNGKCLEENPKNSRKGHRAKSEKHTQSRTALGVYMYPLKTME